MKAKILFMIRYFFVIAGVFYLLFNLTACATHSSANNQVFVANKDNNSTSSLINDLQQQGVQVVHLGQRWRIILPTDHLFKPGSDKIKQKYVMSTIVPLAQLIQSSGHTLVTITGYTDQVGSSGTQKVLSKQYADAIAAYLWAQGVPLSRIKAEGKGNEDRIASNQPPINQFNRRVEVEFWG